MRHATMLTSARSFILVILSLLTISSYAAEIKGFVYDKETGETLIGANVFIKGTTNGTVTDAKGYYYLPRVKEGNHILVASYLSYIDTEIAIQLNADQVLVQDFHLDYGGFDLAEIAITVQAKGQIKAINQQMNALSISNIVSSERIQEVPDATAAESVGRLPGVSVISDNGEGNKVVIRGMEPRFNLVTINGVRAPSTDENENSVGMAGISPFMISGIEVQKSLTPDKDPDVVGGIVDLKLSDADEGFKANIIFQNNTNNIIKKSNFNPRTTLQISNRFLDNRLGIILVGNYENIDRSSHQLDVSDIDIGDNPALDSVIYWKTLRFDQSDLNRERFGASAFLDFRLNGGKISYNIFANGLNDTGRRITENFTRGRSYGKGNNINETSTLGYTHNLKLEHAFAWKSKIEASLSYVTAHRNTPVDYNLGQNFLQDSRDAGGFFPAEYLYINDKKNVDPYDYSKIAPYIRDSSLIITGLDANKHLFDENEMTAKLDWKIPINLGRGLVSGFLKFGGQYRVKERVYDYSTGGAGLTVGGQELIKARIKELNPEINWGGFNSYISQNLPVYPIMDQGLNDNWILDGKFNMRAFADVDLMKQVIGRMDQDKWQSAPNGIVPFEQVVNDYSGNEKIYAGYGMTEFNITKYLQLVGGARYETLITNYKSYGVHQMGTAQATIYEFDDSIAKQSNTYLLPMVNLKFMPVKWMNLRLAYTHSIARPQYYSYMPRFYQNDHNGTMTNIGNPYLKPALSKNYDAYLSFHANKLGLFTIGGFFKEIENYEFKKTYPNITNVLNVNDYHPYDIATTVKEIEIPINNPNKAYSRGVEVDWQSVFWYLPRPFNGIVVNANYTYIDNEQTQMAILIKKEYIDRIRFRPIPVDTSFTRALYNQPNHIVNVSIGYDLKGFSARLAYNRRSSVFLYEIGGSRGRVENTREGSAYEQWDLSVTQRIPKVKGLQLFFNMTNISNSFREESVALQYGGRFPLRQEYYGRATILGIRYTL